MGRIAVMLVCFLGAGRAIAQDRPDEVRLFEEGRELATQGKYEEACAKFKASLELDPAPGTALNYGDCLDKLGKLREAWKAFDEAARAFGADGRAAYARDRAKAIEAKLAVVVVKLAEPDREGLAVRIGDERVPAAPEIEVRREPGDIEVVVAAPGVEPIHQHARGTAGQRVIVDIPAFAVVPARASPDDEHAPWARSPGRVRLSLGLAGAGAAALAGSVVLGLVARSAYNDAVDHECTQTGNDLMCSPAGADRVGAAGTKADIATGLAIGGGLLVAAGVVLYVTAPREQLVVAPSASPSSVGVAVSGAF